jgi:superfamily II DNA/RNA helicase
VQQRPVRHDVGPVGPDPTTSRHAFWSVQRTEQPSWVAHVVRELGSTIVFCRTRHGADRVAKQLTRLGVSAAPIHGGRSQAQRDRALGAFATSTVTTLVATDVAARGIHVDGVAAVVNNDLPADAATYLHRSGRTARAGAPGTVVTMVQPDTEQQASALRRQIGIDVTIGKPDLASLHPSRRPTTAPKPNAEADRFRGAISFFNDRRGYGFIAGADATDVFVHHSAIATKVATGQHVEFAVRPGRKGPEAYDVIAI